MYRENAAYFFFIALLSSKAQKLKNPCNIHIPCHHLSNIPFSTIYKPTFLPPLIRTHSNYLPQKNPHYANINPTATAPSTTPHIPNLSILALPARPSNACAETVLDPTTKLPPGATLTGVP